MDIFFYMFASAMLAGILVELEQIRRNVQRDPGELDQRRRREQPQRRPRPLALPTAVGAANRRAHAAGCQPGRPNTNRRRSRHPVACRTSCQIARYSWVATRSGLYVPMFFVSP